MKLCEYCIANVLESKVSWDYHNHSYDTLTPSSKGRCLFCSTLRKDIRRLAPWLKESDYAEAWPVYRWSIRSLAKIRESPETVVVTFRYVPPKKTGVDASDAQDSIDLPTRTFFLIPDNDLQPLPTIAQLGLSTDPSVNGGLQIRGWITNCDQQHTDCMRRKEGTRKAADFVPTRLLDISGPPKTAIQVIETAKTTVHGPYCSLSHCWGKPDFVQLRDNNRKSFMTDGVPWNMLTNNFRQAIEIARFLNIRYIWIDSLCIIQGNKEDWMREASKMHLVYRYSYCNIAIADSVDQYGGAFRDREPTDVSPVEYIPRESSPTFKKKTWRVVPEDLWSRELLQSSLYTRGWVFQERMLAPRILHFARKQVFWDCPSLSACEALPAGLPRPMDRIAGPDRHWRGRLQEPGGSQDISGPIDQPLSVYWQTAVRNYTNCNLTQRSDKLIALWGIAKLIKDELGVEYGEGLWEDNLEDQLAWRVSECKLKERPITEKRKIPSWSWASMDGEIVVADRLSDKSHRTVCDHNGRDLELDLKGVKRYARSNRPNGPGPLLQDRVQSDSALEVKNAKARVMKALQHDLGSKKTDDLDKDAEPALHNYSIPIQGHVNRGELVFQETKRAWILRPDYGASFDMDVFPDTIPGSTKARHQCSFMVLSAKKVAKLKDWDMRPRNKENVEFEGRGILLASVGQKVEDRFCRVGAFDFRRASAEVFDQLLTTADWQTLPPTKFDVKLGRKIWLE